MGLFDFLGGPNLTKEWVERPAMPLDFDFDECELGGVPVGSEFEKVCWLGRAEGRSKQHDGFQEYYWYSKGLQIEFANGLFHLSTVWFESSSKSKFQPFPGRCVLAGRRFVIEPDATEVQIIELFGEPIRRVMDQDEGVVETLYYQFGEHEYQFEFAISGKLQALYLPGRPAGFQMT